MERTIREPPKTNGRQPETFTVSDPQIGKTFTVRELTDEQIAQYRQALSPQINGAMEQVMAQLTQYTNMVRVDAAMEFELDRRQRDRALKIVPRMNA